MIEIRHLRYFVAVAEELHFGRAAKRLHMAQSPLSQQIRQLERHLGVELIDRPHSVVGLTDAGREFYTAAINILEQLDRAIERTRRAARGEVGTIRVGYVSEVTADLLPLGLKLFRESNPDIDVELQEGPTGDLLDGLRSGDLDVVFVRRPWALDDVQYERLIDEPFMVASPQGINPSEEPHLADLAKQPFVVPTRHAARGLRADIDAAFAKAGFEPGMVREASSLTATLLLAAAGAGLALVPASAAHQYPVPGLNYHRLAEPAPTTGAGVAWRTQDPSLVLRRFLDTVCTFATQHEGQEDVYPNRHIDVGPPQG